MAPKMNLDVLVPWPKKEISRTHQESKLILYILLFRWTWTRPISVSFLNRNLRKRFSQSSWLDYLELELHCADCISELVVAFPLCRVHSLLKIRLPPPVAHHLWSARYRTEWHNENAHSHTTFDFWFSWIKNEKVQLMNTEEREDGDRDGVSGVRELEALEDAEKRGGLGARENPLGYAGAELEKSEWPSKFQSPRHLLAGLIFAGSTLALPPFAAFGDGGRDRDEVTKLGSLPSGLRSLFSGISKLSETSSPSSSCDWFDDISIKSVQLWYWGDCHRIKVTLVKLGGHIRD